jgi:hypothetical protein
MRSVLQTAVAAHAPLQEYLLAVLRTPPHEVAADPERFTPRAWADTQRCVACPDVDTDAPSVHAEPSPQAAS